MLKKDLAVKVGTSWATLGRWARVNNISLNGFSYKPDVVKKVLKFYEANGKRKTQEKFPEVSVRSIVERHCGEFSPRQRRWTDSEIKDLARFGGLLTFKAQAKYFNRPNANTPSIQSAWMKRFGFGSRQINGLAEYKAKFFVKDSCPRVATKFWEQRNIHKDNHKQRSVCLWVDMEKHLRSDCPDFIEEAVTALAGFQRWLFESEKPRTKILSIIKKYEVQEGRKRTRMSAL